MSDSEESDGEGGLGNLNRLIVRPPGHSGKAKRGQLCFDAAFECGNLGRADHISELEYDLFIRPDTCRPRARFWFNFTVENVRQDQRVIFNIVNLGKERTLYCGEMTPLVRSTSRHKWQRIPRRLLFYHRSAVHRGRRILSFAFAFDREEDVYQFAAAAPYSYSRLQKHLALWEKRAQTFATREVIAHTLHKRRVDLITIGDFNIKEREVKEDQTPLRGKTAELKKRVVIIIARVHGGEPPASYICQGFLDYMISSSEKAQALRNGIVLKVIPMLNPDGVFLGNQRSDVLGSDMNRCWHRATTFAHPALIAVNEALNKLYAEKTLQLDFIIDLHADISNEGVFVRGNSYDDVYRFERHAVLPKFLAGRVEAWRTDGCFYNMDPCAAGSARRVLPAAAVDAYSLLASLGGRRLTAKGPFERHAVLPKFLAGRVEAWRTDGCFYNMDPCAAGSARRVLPAAAVDAYSLLASLGGRRLTAKGPFERHAVLPKFLAGRVEAWRTDGCFYNMDPCAAGSARRVLPAAAVDAYSLLASLGGRRLTAKGPYLHYTEDSYFKIGRSLAKSLCDYYRHIGVIPPREGVLKKKKGQRGRHRRRRPITERDRSPSTSRERRPLRPRVVSPPLPPASPPPLRAPPPFRHLHHPARPRTVPDLHPILPLITGTAVRTPRLAVLNMSAYIRSPGGGGGRRGNRTRPRLAKPPRPYHPKITSDEYDTHDSDS